MADLLEELEKKYETLKKSLKEHQQNRLILEDDTTALAEKRDELNKKTRDFFKSAKEAREKRDVLNDRVKKLKSERDTLRADAKRLYEELKEIKRRITSRTSGGYNISQHIRRLRDLERRQETTVLAMDKERALVEEIHMLHSELKKLKKEEEERMKHDKEYMQKKVELSVAKIKLQEIQKQLKSAVEESQKFHDMSVEFFEKASEVKKEADEVHHNFIAKTQKQREEENIIRELMDELRDFEKIITGLKQKQRFSKKQEKESELKKTAQSIFEKFKKGEPLTTEDILILQKAGFM